MAWCTHTQSIPIHSMRFKLKISTANGEMKTEQYKKCVPCISEYWMNKTKDENRLDWDDIRKVFTIPSARIHINLHDASYTLGFNVFNFVFIIFEQLLALPFLYIALLSHLFALFLTLIRFAQNLNVYNLIESEIWFPFSIQRRCPIIIVIVYIHHRMNSKNENWHCFCTNIQWNLLIHSIWFETSARQTKKKIMNKNLFISVDLDWNNYFLKLWLKFSCESPSMSEWHQWFWLRIFWWHYFFRFWIYLSSCVHSYNHMWYSLAISVAFSFLLSFRILLLSFWMNEYFILLNGIRNLFTYFSCWIMYENWSQERSTNLLPQYTVWSKSFTFCIDGILKKSRLSRDFLRSFLRLTPDRNHS